MKIVLFVLLSFCFAAAGRKDGFDFRKLPRGKAVTLPRPAITYVPVTERVTLGSTDIPQVIKLSAVNMRKKAARTIRVAIYDPGSERVRYVDLKPGMPYLYSFSKLESISLVIDPPKKGHRSSQYALRIESDKPLEIRR